MVLAGRPNVGKSTLFNRILGSRRAIVTPVPGTTRDVIEQSATWRGVTFTLTDTGGMFGASEDPLHQSVLEHGRRALGTAHLVVFVVDGREGLMGGDKTIAQTLRSLECPVILAVNKTDDRRAQAGGLECHALGFDPVFEISAEHGTGIAELLDEVIARVKERPQVSTEAARESVETGVAIVGRPNVGKSSLVNRLLHEERMLVNEVPGTTRDAVDAVLDWSSSPDQRPATQAQGTKAVESGVEQDQAAEVPRRRRFRIVDTAGMRRPGRVARSGRIEAVSVLAAGRAIAKAEVVVVVLDALEGATDQDGAIAGEADRAGRGIIIAVNKWDLVKGREPDFASKFDDRLAFQLKFLDYAPVIHLSARTGERTHRLLELIDRVASARRTRVKTPELNRFIKTITERTPPVSPGNTNVRVLYAAQTSVAPPTFVFFTNVANAFHFSYERYLVNQLRTRFGFVGTPIRIQVRRRVRATKSRSTA